MNKGKSLTPSTSYLSFGKVYCKAIELNEDDMPVIE